MDRQIIVDCSTGEQVEEEFAFAPYTPTKAEKLAQLNIEYDAKINTLKIEFAGAGLANSTPEVVQTKQIALIQQRTDLLTEKAEKRSAIING